MKFKAPMLVVADINQTVEFYKKVLGLHVVMDFGGKQNFNGWFMFADTCSMGRVYRHR